MITETIYDDSDLESGKCNSCGDKSDEIITGDGICIECEELDKFYAITIKGL